MNNIDSDNVKTIIEPIQKFKLLKIFTAVLYAIATVLSVVFMIDILNEPQNIGTAFALVVWLCLGAFALAVPLIISLVGLIVCALKVKKGESSKGSVIYFSIFSALPIITYFVCVFIFNIVLV